MADDIVTLEAQDGQTLRVKSEVAKMSVTIKNLIEDAGVTHAIPIPNCSHAILVKVMEYCNYHVQEQHCHQHCQQHSADVSDPDTRMTEWDATYCKLDQETVLEVMLAANYLDIKPLLALASKAFLRPVIGKTPEQICAMYGVPYNFTREQEEEVRREHDWCQEQ